MRKVAGTVPGLVGPWQGLGLPLPGAPASLRLGPASPEHQACRGGRGVCCFPGRRLSPVRGVPAAVPLCPQPGTKPLLPASGVRGGRQVALRAEATAQ